MLLLEFNVNELLWLQNEFCIFAMNNKTNGGHSD